MILGVCATAGEDKEPNLSPLPHFMIILPSRTVILLRVIVKASLHAQATLRPTTLGEFLRKAGTWLVKTQVPCVANQITAQFAACDMIDPSHIECIT